MRLFNSRLEAVKATIVKYAAESGLLSKKDLWKRVKAYGGRKVSLDRLEEDLQRLEHG